MPDTPELDQVADARRRLSSYAGFPRTYWVLYGVALVLMAGLPIWLSFLPALVPGIQWVLLAICLASAAYAVIRRRQTGVRLPGRISSYPGAQVPRYAVLAVTLAGIGVIYALVGSGHRTVALIVLIPVAALVFAGQVWTRARMRADIAAGRVVP